MTTTADRMQPTLAGFMKAVPAQPGGNTPWASIYGAGLREVIDRQARRAPRSLQIHLGPSELGAVCDRQVVGKMAGEPSTNNVKDPWPSIVGTAVHAWLADAFANENLLNGMVRWVPEVRVTPVLAHPGTADLYDAAECAVVDWKVLGPTSLAKVKSANGPPRKYVVQLLLYAMGWRNLGLEVRRVVLAALPRASATLHEMYCWERPHTASDDVLISEVLAETQLRAAIARRVMAREVRIEDVPVTPSDDCIWCFAGETEVVTRDGIKPIAELAGTSPELLVPTRTGQYHGLLTRGGFRQAPVRAFGEQPLWKITLGSRRAEKVIYATAEHRWLLTQRPSRANPGNKHGRVIRQVPAERAERTTRELKPGDRLRPLRAQLPAAGGAQLMPWAVAQGFVFGDGSRGNDSRPAYLPVYDNGKDEALLPFFPFAEPKQYEGVKIIYGLPRFWKDLPPIRESRTFLLSWLAGYFAADGDVTRAGQATLCSASEEAILFARDAAAVCGIGYSPPRSKMRLGRGKELTTLWSLNLRRRDLPPWFFLIKEHAIRAAAASEEEARGTYWTVKSVQLTDRIEAVYCATVPDTEMFGLADDLLTGNCPFFRPESARDGGPGCRGHSPER